MEKLKRQLLNGLKSPRNISYPAESRKIWHRHFPGYKTAYLLLWLRLKYRTEVFGAFYFITLLIFLSTSNLKIDHSDRSSQQQVIKHLGLNPILLPIGNRKAVMSAGELVLRLIFIEQKKMKNGKQKQSAEVLLESENNEENFGKSELQLLNLIAEIIVEIILEDEEKEQKI